MIQIPEKIRINIGLGLIIVLSVMMLFLSINQTLRINHLEQTNRELLRSRIAAEARHMPLMKR